MCAFGASNMKYNMVKSDSFLTEFSLICSICNNSLRFFYIKHHFFFKDWVKHSNFEDLKCICGNILLTELQTKTLPGLVRLGGTTAIQNFLEVLS